MGFIAQLRRLWRKRSAPPTPFDEDPFVALADPEPRRRWEAANALQDSDTPERAVPALVQALGDPEPFVRWQAGQSLIALHTPEALDGLAQALRDDSPQRRAAAAEALGQATWPEVISLLTDALTDADPGVRVAAAISLGRLKDPASVPHLTTRLTYEASPGVRWAIIRALGMIGDASCAAAIRTCLAQRNESPSVRRSAAWALGQLGWDTVVAEGLLNALEDPDPQVRWYACQGFRRILRSVSRAEPEERALLSRIRAALRAQSEDQTHAGVGVVGEAASQALAQLNAKRLT